MGRDMADSFHVAVGNVPPVPNLGPDQGWVGMSVQFLVDAAEAGAASRSQAGYELRYPPK